MNKSHIGLTALLFATASLFAFACSSTPKKQNTVSDATTSSMSAPVAANADLGASSSGRGR